MTHLKKSHFLTNLFYILNKVNDVCEIIEFWNIIICFFQLADRLLKVDNVDAVALREDVRSHFRVPASGLMTEVYAGFEELFHRYNAHFGIPPDE